MRPSHPSTDELSAYVMDMVSVATARVVEDHVVTCPSCAKALATEARIEVALGSTAVDGWRQPLARASSLFVAAAAVCALWLTGASHDAAQTTAVAAVDGELCALDGELLCSVQPERSLASYAEQAPYTPLIELTLCEQEHSFTPGEPL